MKREAVESKSARFWTAPVLWRSFGHPQENQSARGLAQSKTQALLKVQIHRSRRLAGTNRHRLPHPLRLRHLTEFSFLRSSFFCFTPCAGDLHRWLRSARHGSRRRPERVALGPGARGRRASRLLVPKPRASRPKNLLARRRRLSAIRSARSTRFGQGHTGAAPAVVSLKEDGRWELEVR